MKPWQPGDPIGSGEIYLPDAETSQAYGDAVRASFVESHAMTVMGIKTRRDRQQALDKLPSGMQGAVKARILELWDK